MIVYKVARVFFFSSRRRHTRLQGDWSSDVCSSDLWWFTPRILVRLRVRRAGTRRFQRPKFQHRKFKLRRRIRRSEEHTSELQSPCNLVCRLLLEKKTTQQNATSPT